MIKYGEFIEVLVIHFVKMLWNRSKECTYIVLINECSMVFPTFHLSISYHFSHLFMKIKKYIFLNVIKYCKNMSLAVKYISYILGFDDAIKSLEKLNAVKFRLPVDLAVRPFSNIKDAF